MGVVTRGMGGTGCLGGAREGARAAAARGAAARAAGEELGKATVGNERGVSGRSVTRARGADAGASAKRGALVPAEGDERRKSTRRRVGAAEETTVDDLPVRLPSARLVVSPAPELLSFFLILLTTTSALPHARSPRADLARSS